MRMPYQRRTTGPIWNAIAPGELITVLRITRREGRLVVGAAGLEPARPRGQRLLRPSRLPVPPRPHALPSEALVLLVGLLDPSLLVFLHAELLGLPVLLGLLRLDHAPLGLGDPFVDGLDPGRHVRLFALEDERLLHRPEARGMAHRRRPLRLREARRPRPWQGRALPLSYSRPPRAL